MLGELEQLVLLGILAARNEAYGIRIHTVLADRAQQPIAPGTIYTTLARLGDKGLVTSRLTPPRAYPGGRATRVYTVTPEGKKELRTMLRALRRLATDADLEPP